ncbi:zf-HC2 domain-containing protein [Streptomyces sp. NPDC096132]|uniref:zf-HC2 domain-containing protein n=1 Tax=Streptomyces sp. NPDC096132 TaxID=3366075 RepID=UPI00381AA33F
MRNDMTCGQLQEIGAELALGILSGRERADAIAHLDHCADCREHVADLSLLGDGLLGLLPGSEPPVGFETRASQRLSQAAAAAAAHDERAHRTGLKLSRKGLRGRVRLRAAAAAALLALGFGFGGWALGTSFESATTAPSQPAEAEMLLADLTTAGHEPVGEIYAHAGAPGWIYMTVDLAHAGTAYHGRATCLLERKDGSTVRIGTFALRDGKGSWGAPAPVDPATLTGARLTSTDGTVLATARFTA